MSFSFQGIVERRNMGENRKGTLYYTVLYLPRGLVDEPPKKRGLRMRGAIMNSVPLELALQPDSERSHYLILSKTVLKKIDRVVGDEVSVTCDLVDPNVVEVPPLLQRGLDGPSKARKMWKILTQERSGPGQYLLRRQSAKKRKRTE
mmetsp:Transcript_29382/g.43336  ORF Transcript_29382/g.43336 Transcript_29382/m.43336 type:complete len:147 (-) Transcript_29382:264-704(-)